MQIDVLFQVQDAVFFHINPLLNSVDSAVHRAFDEFGGGRAADDFENSLENSRRDVIRIRRRTCRIEN